MTPVLQVLCDELPRLTAARLGNAPASAAETAAWTALVADLVPPETDPEDLRRAIRAHLSDRTVGRWWPAPADLLRRLPETPPQTYIAPEIYQATALYELGEIDLQELGRRIDQALGIGPRGGALTAGEGRVLRLLQGGE